MERTNFDIAIDIAAKPDLVWQVITDVEHWPEWTPSVKSIRRLDKGPLVKGSRALVRQPKLPPAMWKVTEVNDRGFTWTSGLPGLWVIAHHSVEPAESGSRATLSLRYTGLLAPLVARLTRSVNDPYLKLEAEGLKKRSETA